MKEKYLKPKNIFLIILFFLAFSLRFYKLGQIPYSLDWDENSNAYNAYSILKTGRDEYGALLPLTNRSFDDYKPPLYMYLNIATVKIFGLTPYAARLPSAVFGFLTVPFIYLLTKKLFKDEKIALFSAFLLAISPWHVQFSRVGFEATVGLFFAVAAITAFLYGLTNKRYLITSAVFLGISAYSYHAERIFVPLLFIASFILFKKEILKSSKKYLFLFAILTIIIALPLAIFIPPKVIIARFQVTTGRPRLEDIDKSIKFQYQDNLSKFSKIIHNRRLIISQTLFDNYLSHFSFNFLFTQGDDNLRHHIGRMGMLYLFELPLILFGVFSLLKNKNQSTIFVLTWLLIAPIAATPATPNPHANRALPMIIPLIIISSYSLTKVLKARFYFKNILCYFYLFWIVWSFFSYIHNYFIHYPFEKAAFWQYGYRQAVEESEKIKNDYDKINVDPSIEQAYAFWLFNTKYDPKEYQKTGSRFHFDKYYFFAKPPQAGTKELFIATYIPSGFEEVKTIHYPDGSQAIQISRPLVK